MGGGGGMNAGMKNLKATWLIDLQMPLCNTSMWAKWMSIGQDRCTGAKRKDFNMTRSHIKMEIFHDVTSAEDFFFFKETNL